MTEKETVAQHRRLGLPRVPITVISRLTIGAGHLPEQHHHGLIARALSPVPSHDPVVTTSSPRPSESCSRGGSCGDWVCESTLGLDGTGTLWMATVEGMSYDSEARGVVNQTGLSRT